MPHHLWKGQLLGFVMTCQKFCCVTQTDLQGVVSPLPCPVWGALYRTRALPEAGAVQGKSLPLVMLPTRALPNLKIPPKNGRALLPEAEFCFTTCLTSNPKSLGRSFPCWLAIINHKPILCQPYVVCTLLKLFLFSLAFWKCGKFSIKNT